MRITQLSDDIRRHRERVREARREREYRDGQERHGRHRHRHGHGHHYHHRGPYRQYDERVLAREVIYDSRPKMGYMR